MHNRRSLLIATALGEELSPFLRLFQAELVPPLPIDGPYRAYQAELTTEHGGTLDLIFCSTYKKGSTAMGALLAWALNRFAPRRIVLAGIAATVPSSGVSLGDILIAKQIVDSTEAKLVPDVDADRMRRMTAPCDDELTLPLAAYVERLGRKDIAIGTIISQPDVVKSAKARERIAAPVAKFFDEIPIGIEMEGGGLMTAVSACPALLRPSFVMIKGAVDFANIRKNDSVREEVAAKVAHFLRSFLEGGWLVDPADDLAEPKAGERIAADTPSEETSFGRVAVRAELLRELEAPAGARILWIEGLGGIGKTTLAKLLADEAEAGGRFVGRAIYRVQQEHEQTERSAPDYGANIVASFVSQLGLVGLSDLPPQARVQRFFDLARSKPFLLTVDNLETSSDADAVRELLSRVDAASATRWIVTSRAVLEVPWPIARLARLAELSERDSLAMMRDLLRSHPPEQAASYGRSLDSLYQAVGGNPLALTLAVGLLSRFPPDIVVAILRCGADKADELYRHIYKTAWSTLGEDARNLLVAIRVAPVEGVDWPLLQAISGLGLRELTTAVRQLCGLNLLTASEGPTGKTYGIHRLTATFAEEVAGSWRAMEREAFEKAALRRDLFHTLDRLRSALE